MISQSNIQNSEPGLFGPKWRPAGFEEAQLTAPEAAVFRLLKFHVGAARAIKVELVARYANVPEREAREILKHLTEKHGLAIASLVQPPYGVYLVETAEELEAYCEQLKGRALSALKRMAILKRQHLEDLLGQLRIAE